MSETTGIEKLDTEIEVPGPEGEGTPADELEDFEGFHFRVDEPLTVSVGEAAGHDIVVHDVEYFLATQQDSETSEIQQTMGQQPRYNAAHIVVSNEDADIGPTATVVEGPSEFEDEDGEELDGVTLDDAVDAFSEEYL